MTTGIPGLEIPQIIRDKCPIWTGRLENEDASSASQGKFINGTEGGGGIKADIYNHGQCLVGEAHGFNATYKTESGETCTSCRTLSIELYQDLKELAYAQHGKQSPKYIDMFLFDRMMNTRPSFMSSRPTFSFERDHTMILAGNSSQEEIAPYTSQLRMEEAHPSIGDEYRYATGYATYDPNFQPRKPEDPQLMLEQFQRTLNRFGEHLERVHNPKEAVISQEHLVKEAIPMVVKNSV